jgi:hypothetical protein
VKAALLAELAGGAVLVETDVSGTINLAWPRT